MKKNYLIMAALFSATSLMAQTTDTDITPSGYKWAETGAVPAISSVAVKGSNPSTPAFTAWNGETEYNNGLVGIDGANNNNFNPDAIKAGMSVVDLGGEVGKVLAIRGAACSDVEGDLKSATGRDITIPQMTAATTWFDLNFFTDPNNTPTSKQAGNGEALPDDGYIHVKLVMNVYTDLQNADNDKDAGAAATITGISFQNNYNGLNPQGTVYSAVYASDFFVMETEGQYAGLPAYDDNNNGEWDPTRWLVYEFDSYCPAASEKENYAPLRVKMSCNSWANFSECTLFIKEFSFTKCVGTPTTSYYNTAGLTYTTLKPGATETGINVVESATESENAPKYNLAGQRVNDSYKGIVIQNGKKFVVR